MAERLPSQSRPKSCPNPEPHARHGWIESRTAGWRCPGLPRPTRLVAHEMPPIPLALAHRPTLGGLAVPWVNITLADGGVDFRGVHNTKWQQAWRDSICQTCGLPLDGLSVFLGGDRQVAGYFDEPPLHPVCAAYATKACPMVAGKLSHYAKGDSPSETSRGHVCPDEGCDCEGWRPTPGLPQTEHGGEPAHDWWAVYAEQWDLAVSPGGRLLGGIPRPPLRKRLVTLRADSNRADGEPS
ncbi:MAG: hypothetical protein JWP14_3405 [Frankiales bacterium]|nr:hypothetical protein [Frankiales bacterium]